MAEFSDDSDDIPLSKFAKKSTGVNTNEIHPIKENYCNQNKDLDARSSASSMSVFDDDEADPTYGFCEVRKCKKEVFSACHRCNILLCWPHFSCNDSCSDHSVKKTVIDEQGDNVVASENVSNANNNNNNIVKHPEQFLVEGASPEHEVIRLKKNKQKVAKKLRDSGKEYISPATKKLVAARYLKERCNSENCRKKGKTCHEFTEDDRRQIFDEYYSLQTLTNQREFLVRHMKRQVPKRRTTVDKSRRNYSVYYYFTKNSTLSPVCKKFFLHTLDISERATRTALCKVNENGVLEKEKRGGRQRSQDALEKEKQIRDKIAQHIDRFPRIESHYCRAKTTKQYLHSDLSLQKMYDMFLKELEESYSDTKPSLSTYRNIFKSKHLSFYRPKKDLCTLCIMYKQGDDKIKEELRERFSKHTAEKNKVREIKQVWKEKAIENDSILCGVFDLQQVFILLFSL